MTSKLKMKYLQMQNDQGLIEKTKCTKNEETEFITLLKYKEPLPQDIVQSNEGFYKITPKCQFTDQERLEYLILKQTDHLKVIETIALFFAIAAGFSIILTILFLIIS
jgi:hypothetical protein